MNCPFCQTPMKSVGEWQSCHEHKPVAVYVFPPNPAKIEMEAYYGKWLTWEEDNRFRVDDDNINKMLLKLNYHPKIKPEEAREYWDRMMKMVVFS